MERRVLVELYDQILLGRDIPTAPSLLKVSKETAADKRSNLPYSLLTNLAHAVLWQDLWLSKLGGEKTPPSMQIWKMDWQEPDKAEFPHLRDRFIGGLEKARAIADSEPFEHKLGSDEAAEDVLLQIAIHASYHLGQLNLLKRSKKV